MLFLCSGHGQSVKFLEANAVPNNVVIIDLSTGLLETKVVVFTYGFTGASERENSRKY